MFAKKLLLVTIIALTLLGVAACGRQPSGSAKKGKTATEATPAAAAQQAPNALPAATIESSSASLPSAADIKAVETTVQKAVQEQAQALASADPTVMQDTATSSYYDQSVQDLVDMANSGVTAMQLDSLNWGPITFPSATTAQATTTETWSTTLSDGKVVKQTDTNVYTLVLDNGAWKVQGDQHPNSASAQAPATSNTGDASLPGTPATPGPLATGQARSRNWSGYSATGGSFTAITGTWVVPTVKVHPIGMDATWVGIGGVTSTDLIQAGTQAVTLGSKVTYSAWFEMLPQPSQQVPLTVTAGDTITVSIARQADGTWQIVISNVTSGQSWNTDVAYNSSLSSAEWVEEAPAAGRRLVLPLDQFGTVSFSRGTAVENGKTVTIAQAGARPIYMLNGVAQVLARTSVLGPDGASFTVIRSQVVPTPFRRHDNG